jgi:hypothetical protein
MFSALVVMICCAVPAFADDTVTKNDLSSVKWNIVSKSSDIPHFTDVYNNFSSTISKTDNYIAVYGKKSDGTSETNILYFDPTAIAYYSFTNNQFLFGSNFDYDSQRLLFQFDSSDNKIQSVGYGGWNVTKPSGFSKPECRALISLNDYVQSTVKVYFHTKVYDFDDLENELEPPDPNAVPAPFTVTYTPELSLNMQNKIYYPSKGGANADENGLVSAENNNINLDIKLTPEFLKTFNEKDLGKAYGSGTYAVLCCLSKNLLNAGDDLQRFFDEDVVLYAMNHDGNYYKGQDDEKIKSDGSASDDLNSNDTVDTFEPYLTLYQGRTPIYTIPRDGKITVSFDLTSIDYKTHGLTDDSKLYVNVIGVFVKNNGHVTPQNGEKTEDTTSSTWLGSYAYQEDFTNLKTCEKIDDFVKSVDEETGKPETFKAYRVYSVISDPFSYEKFPDYVPKVYKDKDGNTYNPSTTKLKDLCNIPPSKVTDVDLAKGSDGVINDGSYMQPDDYNKYLDKKKINANFGSVDFTDIKSIFSTTGTYWDFLTAALSCLPSWFYAVFSAWFVLFLAIALIKLVLPT